jgi:hypothetical protein
VIKEKRGYLLTPVTLKATGPVVEDTEGLRLWVKPRRKKTMKRLGFCLVVALALALVSSATYVTAAPPGDSRDGDVGKKLFNFNVLAVPQDNWSADDTVCPNSGHRIFFERVSSGSIGSILWTLDPNAPPGL